MGMRDNKLAWLVEPQYRHRLLGTRTLVELQLAQDSESVSQHEDQTNGI